LNKILVIQTAFIGDVILATSVLEKLHEKFLNARLDILVRNGNEILFDHHPYINQCIVWNKTNGKYKSLFSLISQIRKTKYDIVINLHRFASSGFITIFSDSKNKIGFDKNPFSFLFTKKVKHQIGNGLHEVERNHLLISEITDPKLNNLKKQVLMYAWLHHQFGPQNNFLSKNGLIYVIKQLMESAFIYWVQNQISNFVIKLFHQVKIKTLKTFAVN